MDQNAKLDSILDKLNNVEMVPEKQRLHELARLHWGFSEDDLKLIEQAKSILDTGRNTQGKLLQFMFTLSDLEYRYGADTIIKHLENMRSELK